MLLEAPKNLHEADIKLEYEKTVPGDPTKGLVPFYHFKIKDTDGDIVGHGVDGDVAGDGFEVGKANLDTDRFADIAFTLQILGNPLTEIGEDAAQFRPVTLDVQVLLKSGFAAEGFGLSRCFNRSFINTVRCVV